jgi:hypothetical protein
LISDKAIIEEVVATYRRILAGTRQHDDRALIIGLIRETKAWQSPQADAAVRPQPIYAGTRLMTGRSHGRGSDSE